MRGAFKVHKKTNAMKAKRRRQTPIAERKRFCYLDLLRLARYLLNGQNEQMIRNSVRAWHTGPEGKRKAIMLALMLAFLTAVNAPGAFGDTIPCRYEVFRSIDPPNTEIVIEWGNLEPGHKYHIVTSCDLANWQSFLFLVYDGPGTWRQGFASNGDPDGCPQMFIKMIDAEPPQILKGFYARWIL